MASKNYDEYEVEQLIKSKKQGDDYAEQRKAQAKEAVDTSDSLYDTAIESAQKNYEASAKKTESGYRQLYDANAVQELVARRNVEEAMANMGLTDSGLNRTQQTAISLQRGRADYQTSMQKQSAVDAIMRELDARRAELESQKTAVAAGIQTQADTDILNFRNSADAAARQNAASLYAADQEAEAARYAAEQEAATKQAQMLLDAQKAQADERVKMLELGYQWDEKTQTYIKQPSAAGVTGQLTNDQIKLVLDYMDKTGTDYETAKKDIFGTEVFGGYNSLYEAATDHYNITYKNVEDVKNSIPSPEMAMRQGIANNKDYPGHVTRLLENAIADGKITASQAAEIAIEVEAIYGVDLGLGE